MMSTQSMKTAQETTVRQGKGSGAIASLIVVLLAAGCANPSASTLSPSPTTGGSEKGNTIAFGGAPAQDPSRVQTSPRPSTSTALNPLPVPNLIPATTIPERLPEVTTNRPDPFATLLMSPTRITRVPSQPVPSPSNQPLPTVATAPATVPIATMPAPTIPVFQPPAGGLSLPITPPISAAQAIEVSGVVQTGNTISIIIKSPDERTSRYVSVGDRLANGRVLVKRVEMGAEPVVILEQDNAEVVKAIGSSGSRVGTL
ncbi:MAG: hypothetical protein HY785_05185 [Oscillatoriophycideae cyanobacterium NC_groundwater_1537_Pr4_S-0.65um_50_18]|nr:hypothetical protein [Oscillatoriophycideae cyanobacterium NC_groundwater_1537_Pr4_S-0.65um_50_18]